MPALFVAQTDAAVPVPFDAPVFAERSRPKSQSASALEYVVPGLKPDQLIFNVRYAHRVIPVTSAEHLPTTLRFP